MEESVPQSDEKIAYRGIIPSQITKIITLGTKATPRVVRLGYLIWPS
jgi:hypothetical protein